jgi:transglutaminase-like putative cysteine protease
VPSREVGAEIEVQVIAPTTLEFQIAVARLPGLDVSESLAIKLNGKEIEPKEIIGEHETRIHRLHAEQGSLTMSYSATVSGHADTAPIRDIDMITYLRPSRYAESDRLAAVARGEFGGIGTGAALLAAVSSWVGTRLSYVPGSSRPIDGAVDTLLLRQGVCRDYAHLVIALLRALDIPARLAAVYAPGLEPMDFHAVAEALVGDQWCVVDATLLAPRASLIRIATGRDAADTAFMSTYGGAVELIATEVTATIDGVLPSDDVNALVSIG